MGISVEIVGLPATARLLSAHVTRRVGELPAATVEMDFTGVTADRPDPVSLRGARVVVRGSAELGIAGFLGGLVFSGTAVDVVARYWPPDKLSFRVDAIEGPLGASVDHQHDAVWASFPEHQDLHTVASALLVSAGFAAPSFKAKVADKTPGEVLCAGEHPWEFLQRLLDFHAVGWAQRLDDEGRPIQAIVRSAGELAPLGKPRSYGAGAQASGVLRAHEIEIARRVIPPDSGVAWWDSAKEEFGVAGEKSRLGSQRLFTTESIAKTYQPWLKLRERGADVVLRVKTDDPLASLGDKVAVTDSGGGMPWLAGYLSGESLYVIGIEIECRSEKSQDVNVWLTLARSSAPVSWKGKFHDRVAMTIAGEVLSVPPGQGRMKVALEAPAVQGKRPEVHCEWMSPCFSGKGGGLNMPPLKGDKVRLLVEAGVYGRVVYLGSVAGNHRLAIFRDALAGHYEAQRPNPARGGGDPPIRLDGNHLARAIGASPSNLMVWASPDAGLAHDAASEAALRWSVLASPSSQNAEVAVGGAFVRHLAGSAVRLEVKLEGDQLSELSGTSEENVGGDARIVAENVTVQARTDVVAEGKATVTVQGKDRVTVAADEISVEANRTASVTGGQVAIDGGAGVVDIKGQPIKLNS